METRHKGTTAKTHSAEALENTQTAKGDNVSPALDPILLPVPAADSSPVSGTQQPAYLTNAGYSAAMSDLLEQLSALTGCYSHHCPEFKRTRLLHPHGIETEENEEDPMIELEEAAEDFLPLGFYTPDTMLQAICLSM